MYCAIRKCGLVVVGSICLTSAADAADILFYGPSAGIEASMASALGHTVTVATAAQWSSMTAGDFEQYDAIAFGDANCTTSSSYLATADSNKTIWSGAASGRRVFIATDIGRHFGGSPTTSAGHQLLDQILDFVSGGVATGIYFSAGCTYFSAALDTPIPVISEYGDFRITGQSLAGTCNQVAIDEPGHPTVVGLTSGDLAYGCSVHGIFTTKPANVETVARGIGSSLSGGWLLATTDSDGDGISDDDDACPMSNLSATVMIEGCDSGVANALDAAGCTIADGVGQCAADASNHGAFVSCVAHLTNELKDAGTITGRENGAIQRCAAQADLP